MQCQAEHEIAINRTTNKRRFEFKNGLHFTFRTQKGCWPARFRVRRRVGGWHILLWGPQVANLNDVWCQLINNIGFPTQTRDDHRKSIKARFHSNNVHSRASLRAYLIPFTTRSTPHHFFQVYNVLETPCCPHIYLRHVHCGCSWCTIFLQNCYIRC